MNRFSAPLALVVLMSVTGMVEARCDRPGASERYGVRDDWTHKDHAALGVADFGSACDAHQACYEAEGRLQSSCDREFHEALKKRCEVFASNPNALEGCLKTADKGFDFVRRNGGYHYRAAQRKRQLAEREQDRRERYEERRRKRMDAWREQQGAAAGH